MGFWNWFQFINSPTVLICSPFRHRVLYSHQFNIGICHMILKVIHSSNFFLKKGNESTDHWISQRISSVLLLPLSVFFVINFIKVMDKPFNEVLIKFQDPINNLLTISFILVSLWHYQQGMQIVLEDYIHNSKNRKLTLGINRVLCWILAIVAMFSFINIYLMKV